MIHLLVILVFNEAFSQTTAQWRGRNRDGHYGDKGLLNSWPAEGPPQAWSVDGIGKGYSSAVWDGSRFFVTGLKGQDDYLSAINSTGQIIWQVPIGPGWSGSFPESRCTPAVEDGKVYVICGSGIIGCFDAMDGRKIWSLNGIETFAGAYGEWGVCESPLLSGEKLIYSPAGQKTTLVALDKQTGKTLWMSKSIGDTSAYVSPLLIEHGGKKIILTVLNSNVIGVDEKDGAILWTYEYAKLMPEKGLEIWPGAPKTNTITPVFRDGEFYITGGYNHVGVKFRISDDASSITQLWIDTVLDCHMGGIVLIDEYLYGSNWYNNSNGSWCCIDWNTGNIHYETKWISKGAIIAADGKLYCVEEKSCNVALVNPVPDRFDKISSFKTSGGTGPAWAHPSIFNKLLLVRRGDVLMAYDLTADDFTR